MQDAWTAVLCFGQWRLAGLGGLILHTALLWRWLGILILGLGGGLSRFSFSVSPALVFRALVWLGWVRLGFIPTVRAYAWGRMGI